MKTYKKGAFVHIVNAMPREWEAEFRRIKNLRSLEHIEIWLEYLPNAKEISILKDIFKSTETIIHGPFVHMSFVSHLPGLTETSLRRCEEAINIACSIGAKVITFHAGTYPIFDEHKVALERLCQVFPKFTKLTNPTVCLENMPVRPGTTNECLGKLSDLKLLQTMMPDVRFTLDIGHCLQNGDDFEMFIGEQHRVIENIHLHDGNRGGKSHLRLGSGTLDLPSFLKTLRRIEFTKYLSLETISHEDTSNSWQTLLDADI